MNARVVIRVGTLVLALCLAACSGSRVVGGTEQTTTQASSSASNPTPDGGASK